MENSPQKAADRFSCRWRLSAFMVLAFVMAALFLSVSGVTNELAHLPGVDNPVLLSVYSLAFCFIFIIPLVRSRGPSVGSLFASIVLDVLLLSSCLIFILPVASRMVPLEADVVLRVGSLLLVVVVFSALLMNASERLYYPVQAALAGIPLWFGFMASEFALARGKDVALERLEAISIFGSLCLSVDGAGLWGWTVAGYSIACVALAFMLWRERGEKRVAA